MTKATQTFFCLTIISVLAGVAYFPSFTAGFVYDDHSLVQAVPAYRDFDLRQILFGLGNGLEYLPVRDLSLAVDAQIWGQNPRGYHLANFLYFILVLVLLFRVIWQTAVLLGSKHPVRIAFGATLIFALHPLNTEAVAFIAARNNILALLFILLSALGFLAGLRLSNAGFLLSLTAFTLALLSKASAVFFPAALALVYLCLVPLPHQRPRAWVLITALFALALTGAALHLYVAGQTGVAQPDLARFGINDFGSSIVRASLVPIFYLRYFLIPWPQSVSYNEVALLGWANGWVALALYACYLSVFLLVFRHRRRLPLVLAGVCWFFAALVPVANLVPTFPFVADRYLFPGMPGLALVVAVFIAGLGSPWARRLILAVLATVLVTLTFQYSRVWQSDVSLWAAAWKTTPETSAHAYFDALMADGQVDKALALAAAESPTSYRYPLLLCESHNRSGRYAQAIAPCSEALDRSLGYSAAVRNQISLALARAYEQTGDVYQALHYYLKLSGEETMQSRLFFQTEASTAVSRLQDILEPRRHELETAASNHPADVRARGEYGLFLLRSGRFAEAAEQLQQAAILDPANAHITYNLGLAATRDGDLELAESAFLMIPKTAPFYAEGLNHLARFHNRQGEAAEALELWTQAVAAQPANPSYRYNLARQYLRLGSRDEARSVMQEGLRLAPETERDFYRQAIRNLGL